MLAGVAPIPASSGLVVRYRLNRGGDRQLNRALHTIVMIREAWHEPTKRYVARRTAQGKSPREVRRCLTREVARGLYCTGCWSARPLRPLLDRSSGLAVASNRKRRRPRSTLAGGNELEGAMTVRRVVVDHVVLVVADLEASRRFYRRNRSSSAARQARPQASRSRYGAKPRATPRSSVPVGRRWGRAGLARARATARSPWRAG